MKMIGKTPELTGKLRRAELLPADFGTDILCWPYSSVRCQANETAIIPVTGKRPSKGRPTTLCDRVVDRGHHPVVHLEEVDADMQRYFEPLIPEPSRADLVT